MSQNQSQIVIPDAYKVRLPVPGVLVAGKMFAHIEARVCQQMPDVFTQGFNSSVRDKIAALVPELRGEKVARYLSARECRAIKLGLIHPAHLAAMKECVAEWSAVTGLKGSLTLIGADDLAVWHQVTDVQFNLAAHAPQLVFGDKIHNSDWFAVGEISVMMGSQLANIMKVAQEYCATFNAANGTCLPVQMFLRPDVPMPVRATEAAAASPTRLTASAVSNTVEVGEIMVEVIGSGPNGFPTPMEIHAEIARRSSSSANSLGQMIGIDTSGKQPTPGVVEVSLDESLSDGTGSVDASLQEIIDDSRSRGVEFGTDGTIRLPKGHRLSAIERSILHSKQAEIKSFFAAENERRDREAKEREAREKAEAKEKAEREAREKAEREEREQRQKVAAMMSGPKSGTLKWTNQLTTVKGITVPLVSATKPTLHAADHDPNYEPSAFSASKTAGTRTYKATLQDVAATLVAGIPFQLIGPRGTGKTTGIEWLCATMNMPLVKVEMHKHRTNDELVGFRDIRAGKNGTRTKFVFGPLLQAMTYNNGEGCVLFLSEFDRAPSDCLNIIKGVANNLASGSLYVSQTGETYSPGPNFRMIADGNVGGLETDQGGVYTDAQQIDGATIDRFLRFEVGYPDADIEQKILRDRCGVDRKVAVKMVSLANKTREAAARGEMYYPLSTRRLVGWAEASRVLGFAKAFAFSVLTAVPSSEVAVVAEMGSALFGTDLDAA